MFVVPGESHCDHLNALLRTASFAGMGTWLSTQMGAYVASIVKCVRMLVGDKF